MNPALTLADRTFTCQSCGLTIDRGDRSAAINLATWGEQQYLSQALDTEARARVSAHAETQPEGFGVSRFRQGVT